MNLCCFQLGGCFINSTHTSGMCPPPQPSNLTVGCHRNLGGSQNMRDNFFKKEIHFHLHFHTLLENSLIKLLSRDVTLSIWKSHI